jgi:quercetin dioxygenase-like cupin family protein
MTIDARNPACGESEQVYLHALQALPPSEVIALEAHLAGCDGCRRQLEALRSIMASFVGWPTDVLRPAAPLWDRLAKRIAAETGGQPLAEPAREWNDPEWDQVAPGISCKLLATDPDRSRVSMLVRLAPGTDYPPHRHGGVEELYLLEGVLIVDDRTLYPGDYIHAKVGSVDSLVRSETGCTCVLITSTRDELR